MSLPGTIIEVTFVDVVVDEPLVVNIQNYAEEWAYCLYGANDQEAVQDIDFDIELSPDFLTYNITPLQPLLDKIAIDGTNRIKTGRLLPLTTDFDNDDAFVREKLVTEFDRVWMALQQQATGVAEEIDEAVAAAEAAAAAAAASAVAAQAAAQEAEDAAAGVAASAAAAAASATNAANSASAAASSATAASGSATAAAGSATAASNSATSASNSASTATTQAGNAAASASAASTSAGNAATAATNAAASATTAGTHATNAANSAAAAATSATDAVNSATAAAGSATAASGSATAASGSASAAASSATAADASADSAAIDAVAADASATAAAASAAAAATSETNAATSATNADTSEANAATSATNAANSATAAAGSATAAAGSATAADASADAAAISETNAAASAAAAAASAASLTYATATEVLTGTEAAKIVSPDTLAALWEQGSNVAGASTISLGEGGYFNITGSGATIADIDFATTKAGRKAWLVFAGVNTLTHSANLLCPGGVDLATSNGMTVQVVSEGGDIVRVVAIGGILTGGGGGSGDVVGPAGATADNPTVFDGTSGKLIKEKTYANFKTSLALVKADVGLGNVDNTSDANKPVSTAQQTALDLKANINSPTFTGDPKAPTPSAADNDTSIATTAYVTAAVSAIIASADAMVFKGVIDASANPNYPAADAGHTYRISVAGKIGGASGPNVEVGDLILCLTDGTAAGNHATVGANWSIVQSNLDGAVIGPTSSVSGNPAVFSGTTGKLIAEVTFSAFKSSLALVKDDVGLGNVDNTSDANKPVSTAQQTALNLKADLASPALTGNPTAPTPATGDNDTSIATTAFVKAQGYAIGTIPTAASTTEALTGTDAAKFVTPDALAALWEKGSNVTAAATISLGEGGYFTVTGNTTITDVDFATAKDGRTAWVVFTGTPTLTHSSNLILPGGANIAVEAGDTACFVQENADVVRCVCFRRIGTTPKLRLKRITFITASTTWNRDNDVVALWVRAAGGGGGGGGAATAASSCAAGGGGGGAEYVEKWIPPGSVLSSYVCTIGAGGTAGSTGGGNGGTGGTTSLGSTLTAIGGGLGGGAAASSAVSYTANGGGGGSGGTGADLSVDGGAGMYGHMDNTSNRGAGAGGSSVLGAGAKGWTSNTSTATVTGTLGKGFGGGGSGGISSTSTGAAGGAGAPGVIAIHEFALV